MWCSPEYQTFKFCQADHYKRSKRCFINSSSSSIVIWPWYMSRDTSPRVRLQTKKNRQKNNKTYCFVAVHFSMHVTHENDSKVILKGVLSLCFTHGSTKSLLKYSLQPCLYRIESHASLFILLVFPLVFCFPFVTGSSCGHCPVCPKG